MHPLSHVHLWPRAGSSRKASCNWPSSRKQRLLTARSVAHGGGHRFVDLCLCTKSFSFTEHRLPAVNAQRSRVLRLGIIVLSPPRFAGGRPLPPSQLSSTQGGQQVTPASGLAHFLYNARRRASMVPETGLARSSPPPRSYDSSLFLSLLPVPQQPRVPRDDPLCSVCLCVTSSLFHEYASISASAERCHCRRQGPRS